MDRVIERSRRRNATVRRMCSCEGYSEKKSTAYESIRFRSLFYDEISPKVLDKSERSVRSLSISKEGSNESTAALRSDAELTVFNIGTYVLVI